MRWVVLSLVLAACGGKPERAPQPARALGGDLVDPGAGSSDTIVATVEGRPVWASCVAGHVKARGVSVDQALSDCVDLELLAIEAVRRGVGADDEVQDELRAALVDALVATEFEAKVKTAADLPAKLVETNVERNIDELDKPEARVLVYARAPVAKGAPPGGPEDQAAKALSEEIAAALPPATFPAEFGEIARRVAAGRKVEVATPSARYLSADFGRPAYAIPEIGRVSPPTRTQWGWDLILLVDIQPAQHRTRAQLVEEMFPGLRRGYFDQVWTGQLARGHAIERHPEALAEPEEAGSGSAAP